MANRIAFKRNCILAAFALVFLTGDTDAVKARYYCIKKTGGFIAEFRLNTEGDTSITGLTAVNASVDPTSGTNPAATSCQTTTTENPNIYHLTLSIDTFTLDCGTASIDGFTYKMVVRADGTSSYFSFTCDTTDLLGDSVATANFATTGVTSSLNHYENPYGVTFQALEADGKLGPATSVDLGQDIKLRLIYNTGTLEDGPDNWGRVFHTGYIQHPGADTELVLVIATPGFGTKVHVTGQLGGKTVDFYANVKRDAAVEVTIPVEYQATTATKTSWTVETRGLRIEALHDRIGVLVVSANGKGSDFVALPDDVLGMKYRPFSSKTNNALTDGSMEVLVVASEDSTTVTLTYNSFTKGAGFQVDGNDATSDTSSNIPLDEYEVLHILCDTQCSELLITSSKPIAVVTGWPDNYRNGFVSGHLSTQIPPTKYFSRNHIWLANANYNLVNDDPTDNALTASSAFATDGTATMSFVNGPASEAVYNKPVSLYLDQPVKTVSASSDPSNVAQPSMEQWSLYNSFYAKEGSKYKITIVTTKGDTASISVSFGGITTGFTHATLGEQTGFASKLTNVAGLASDGGTPRYEVYQTENDFNVVDTDPERIESGLIEFRASSSRKPFMMLILESKDSYTKFHLPFGVRYPVVNGCTATLSRPGDLLDNDCDGAVDEEIINGVDDDGDGETDEDMALNTVTRYRGIYVKTLLIADNAGFTNPTTVHSDGCNAITSTPAAFKTITPFTHNTDLASLFDDFWVLDTDKFDAFKYVSSDTVFFRVTFDFCYGDLSLCQNSCIVKRKKRSVTENDMVVDLQLTVRGNSSDVRLVESESMLNQGKDDGEHPCSENVVFWLPVALILATILVEAYMLGFVIYKRSKARQ